MILDAHAHISPDPKAPVQLLEAMRCAGIARAIVVAGGVVSREQLARQLAGDDGLDIDANNDAVLRAAVGSEGRLIPFFYANPHRGASDYRAAGAAFAGLKLGPVVHGVGFADPRTHALLEAAREFGHPLYTHCLARPGLRVTDLVALARLFPTVRIILGHAGIGPVDFGAVELLVDAPNVWFETSGGFTSVIAAACAKLGARRVLFGGEFPLQSPAAEVAKIRHAGLSATDCELVLGGSLAALLQPSTVRN